MNKITSDIRDKNYSQDKRLESFVALFRKHYGEEISYKSATDRALRLIRLVKLVYNL